jgi:hypothetical protein
MQGRVGFERFAEDFCGFGELGFQLVFGALV